MKKTSKNNKKKIKSINCTNNINTQAQSIRNSLKPRTENQKKYIEISKNNDIIFCHGMAGSGKTHIAIGVAIEYLLTTKVKKIIVTRPVIEAGEKIGYLPGTAEEKLHPYLLPIIDEIHYFLSPAEYTSLRLNNKIEIVPLGLMRGRNFHNSFIVADECQNASYDQLKMLLTRIGTGSKMILTGDMSQSDLHYNLRGGFSEIIKNLNGIDGIGIIQLESSDIIRHPLISKILYKLDSYERTK